MSAIGDNPTRAWIEYDAYGREVIKTRFVHARVARGPTQRITHMPDGKGRFKDRPPMVRTRCKLCTKMTMLHEDDEGDLCNATYCCFHKKYERRREFHLGSEGIYKDLFPQSFQKKLDKVLNDPEAGKIDNELALARSLFARMLEVFQQQDAAFGDPKMIGMSLKITEMVTKIAERKANIDRRSEDRLNYKSVLVLLDACVNWMLGNFGKDSSEGRSRELLSKMLPDLPWPSGVAKLHGSEGWVGKRGALLIPTAAETRDKEIVVRADWPALQQKYQNDDMLTTRAGGQPVDSFVRAANFALANVRQKGSLFHDPTDSMPDEMLAALAADLPAAQAQIQAQSVEDAAQKTVEQEF